MAATSLLSASGHIDGLSIEIKGDPKFYDTLLALRKDGTLATDTAADLLAAHTDGYSVKLSSKFSSDQTGATNKNWFNCVHQVTEASTATTPGAYCVYASVGVTAGAENKLALHWIPQSKLGGSNNPAADVIIAPTYTFSPTTTGLDRFQAQL